MKITNMLMISKAIFFLSALTISVTQLLPTPLMASFIEDDIEANNRHVAIKHGLDKNSEKDTSLSSFELLPQEILFNIFSFINCKEDVDNCALVSKTIHGLITSPYGLGVTKRVFKIHNQNDFTNFINKYWSEEILDFPIKLEGSWVTSITLLQLSRATTVHLKECNNATNFSLWYLSNATTVKLLHCRQITDDALFCLKDVKNVGLSECQITGKCLQYFKNATSVDLSYCHHIRDAYLEKLGNVTKLKLTCCMKITDAGLQYLQNVENIDLVGCGKFTDAGLKNLKKAKNRLVPKTLLKESYFYLLVSFHDETFHD